MRSKDDVSAAARPFGVGTFEERTGEVFAGLVVGDRVNPLEIGTTVRDLLEDWERSFPLLQDLANEIAPDGPESLPLGELRPLPPVQPPGQLFCAGANYREHVAQMLRSMDTDTGGSGPGDHQAVLEAMDERQRSGRPYVWVASANATSGAFDDIVLPNRGELHDWELELAVVIGRRARHVPRDHAYEVVAGYTVANDLSTRDRIKRPDIPGIGTDWLEGKNAPTFFPIGPYIVPAIHVGKPAELRMTLRLNGQTMQDASPADMIFDVARLIEYVSSILELRPGDLILTGSPHGNGGHHGRFLREGDVIEAEITGLGRQRNRCVSEQLGQHVMPAAQGHDA